MQIQNIILYNEIKGKRELKFNLGKVNVITGSSRTGKTALIDIVDYCLGSENCQISEGIIRDNVDWFAVTLVFSDGSNYFIARENPDRKGQNSTSEIYLQEIKKDCIPELSSIVTNTNRDALTHFLTTKIGISEYIHIPEAHTRNSLRVNFRHSRFYSFQPQDVIGQRNYLFYKQGEQFLPQTMKDTLPYFLGAVNENSFLIMQKIREAKRELNILIRQKKENESIKSEGIGLAYSLIDEAKSFEILPPTTKASSLEEAMSLLYSIKDWELPKKLESANIRGENSTLKQLILNRNTCRTKLGELEDSINATESYIKNTLSYSSEIKEQEIRLSSAKIFTKDQTDIDCCPLCKNKMDNNIAGVQSISQSLVGLHNSLIRMNRENPHLNEYLVKIKDERQILQEEIIKIENSIYRLYEENDKASRLRDLNLRKGKIIGRISLFIESVNFTEDEGLNKKIKDKEDELESLLQEVDKDTEQEDLSRICNRINNYMSKNVEKLDVEYKNSLARLDIPKLTVFADTDDKSIPLYNMGSGANWVNYHILIHFALHKHFTLANRPTPRFIIIDQPTQAYFPPEKKSTILDNKGNFKESSDEIAVKKIYDFIENETAALNGRFQVIVTDHAYLTNKKFEDSVVEVWRDGKKLIPEEWYME